MAWVYLFQLVLGHRYQSRYPRLPSLNVPYSEWHWMSSLDIWQPQTWSRQDSQALGIPGSHVPAGAAPPWFQPVLVVWRARLSTIPPTFPFTIWQPWPSAREMVVVALTVEYQKECLKVGRFDVRYECITAWWHCDCSTKGWGYSAELFQKLVVTQFVDIYHLFISTERTRGRFLFHTFALMWSSVHL